MTYDPQKQEELEETRRKKARRNPNSAYKETVRSLVKTAKGPKYRAPLEAIKLARELRKHAENHERTPWVIAFSIAIACDCMDSIPVAGWMISYFFRPFLFIFLWGKGAWKLKLVYYVTLAIDFIPFFNIIPLSTACVLYAYWNEKKKYEKYKEIMANLENLDTLEMAN